MAATWLRIRSGLRSSGRPAMLLIILVSLGGACVLTALSGARRTQTAMTRFVAYSRPEDLSLFFDPTPGIADRVLRLPEVARTTRLPFLMVSTTRTGLGNTAVFGGADPNLFHLVDRPLVLRGHLPNPRRPDEAVVNDRAEAQEGLHIGSRVRLYGFSREQVAKVSQSGFRSTERPDGPQFEVHVVGVIREPDDIAVVPVAQHSIYDSSGSLYTTPAFLRRYSAAVQIPFEQLPGNEIVRVQLRHGARDIPAFTAAATRVAGDHVQVLPGSDARATAAAVQRGVTVEAIALLTFAGLAALAMVVLVGLVLGRMMRVAGEDLPQLTMLGMTRRQVLGVAVAWPFTTVLLGCLLAIALAIAASPLTPVGIARQAEVHSGLDVNVAVLATAAGALLLLLVGCVLLTASSMVRSLQGSRYGRSQRRATVPAGVLRRSGLGPSATLGVNAALARRPGAALRRSTITAVTIATAAVVGAATFGASLDHLISNPKQQGWNFDAIVGNVNDQNDQVARDAPRLERNRDVGAFSAIATPPETPTIDGRSVGLVGIGEMKGTAAPIILAGRFARAPDEIVMGRRSLRALHKRIGDRVSIAAGRTVVSARITGMMLSLSAGSAFNSRLDEGAAMPLAGLKQLEPDAFVTVFAVRFTSAANRGEALESLRHDFGSNMLLPVPAQDVENLARVDALPAVLAALVVLLAAATLAHNLFTSVYRRRRAFATLKALGFERSQIAGSVFWQTGALTICGIALGLPAGVMVGRGAWRFVADQIGSVQQPVVPLGVVGACVVGAIIVGGLIAITPAAQAAHTGAARILRDE
jgi:hypothetical protein